jgi:hypothetical protein
MRSTRLKSSPREGRTSPAMCNLYDLTEAKRPFATCSARSVIARATCHSSLRSSLINARQLFVMGQAASASLARWGMPSPPQFGGAPITNIRNVGGPHWRGWLGQSSALSRRRRFANTRTRSRARRQNGSRLMRTGHCSPPPACGRPGAARAAPRAPQSRASTNFSAS